VARYGVGDWQASVQALDEAVKLGRGRSATEFFFLAMAHWQLGDRDKAHEWYERGARTMEAGPPADEELRRFRAQAATLLGLRGVSQEGKELRTKESRLTGPGGKSTKSCFLRTIECRYRPSS
jgi:hypothetical protein